MHRHPQRRTAIFDHDLQAVGPAPQQVGEVEAEGGRTALVSAGKEAVDKDKRGIIGGADVQDHALAGRTGLPIDVSCIPARSFKIGPLGLQHIP